VDSATINKVPNCWGKAVVFLCCHWYRAHHPRLPSASSSHLDSTISSSHQQDSC